MKFIDSIKTRARSAFQSIRNTTAAVAATATAALVAAPAAMATPGGFDTTAITAAITENLGKALIVIGAFLVAVWTLRALGLLGRK